MLMHHVYFYLCYIPGHKDSVTCVSFSHDGTMVASGDMSGIIKVWKLDKMDEIWSFEGSDLEVCLKIVSFGTLSHFIIANHCLCNAACMSIS